ncbi:hypothetical protein SAMN05421767_102101 [Granulicatella balaenopterae]|uniref:Uncharacterized protein n=1 Tax=Granulicatella balaenopterae TaxID=137733 RepID=A0A1H9HHJ6_9LACT|nr:hypothetical protein [Granulicatella balaenopterae]SEQ61767.1 hypothetical protein SAMN05421767_102101 [Granulicatella balaenopterae]
MDSMMIIMILLAIQTILLFITVGILFKTIDKLKKNDKEQK